ncbi:hypothetical protein BJ912DRAFT_322823 [Pholiota molesta]|nr:hypothetical protein BJ912DRAFT_322823 [Pholiota molesta]
MLESSPHHRTASLHIAPSQEVLYSILIIPIDIETYAERPCRIQTMTTSKAIINHAEDEESIIQTNDVDKTEEDIRTSNDENNSSGEENECSDNEEYDSSEEEEDYPQWAGGRPRAAIKRMVTGPTTKSDSKTSLLDKDKSKDKVKPKGKDKDDKGIGSNSKKVEQPVAGPAKKQ